jgi:hypothetical protein
MTMTLDELRALLASGEFHHATYRNQGSLWEGLWIYKGYDGLRGFHPAGCFGKDSPDLPAAEALVRGTGISVGAYGAG